MSERREYERAESGRRRRGVLAALGTVLTGTVSGCTVTLGDGDAPSDGNTVDEETPTAASDGTAGEATDTEADGWHAGVAGPSPDQWSQYRYDLRNTGHNRAASGPSGGVELKWRADIGENVRTPVVADGVLYVLAASEGALYALDAATGEEVWVYEDERLSYYRVEEDGYYRWVNTTTPAVANGHVYISADAGAVEPPRFRGLLAIDRERGELAWEFETSGVPTSPVVADGTIYIATQYLFAVDRDGNRRWAAEGSSGHPPAVVDGRVYATMTEDFEDRSGGEVKAYDAANGDLLWEGEAAGNTAPIVVNDRIFMAHLHGVNAFDASGEGRNVWAQDDYWEIATWSPVLAHGNVYAYQRADYGGEDTDDPYTLFAFDARTGERNWASTMRIDDSPAAAGDSLYVHESDGVVSLDPADGSEHWVYELDVETPPNSSLIVDDGVIYVVANDGREGPGTVFALEESS